MGLNWKDRDDKSDEALRKKVERRFDAIWAVREEWLPRWKKIREFIDPERGRFDVSKDNKGKDQETALLNETPVIAARILAAGMQSGLTSPARPWFRLGLANKELGEREEMRAWLNIVQDRFQEIYSSCGLYNALHDYYEELADFGTGCMYAERNFDNVMRARTFTIGQYGLGTGGDGRVDCFAREFSLTAYELQDIFGEESVSEAVKRAMKNGSTEQRFTVRHLIEPNADRVEGAPGRKGAAFAGYYWETAAGGEKKGFLRVDTHEYFPILASRWLVVGGDVYGRKNPGYLALGSSRQLQALEKDSGRALKKGIDPPLVGPSSLKDHPEDVNILPGGVSWVPDTAFANGLGLRSAYQVQFDHASVQQKIQMLEYRINQIFYTDLFTMLTQARQTGVTATAIEEQVQEKMTIIGPVIERQEDELLNPLIDLSFYYALEAGVIPPPPEIASGEELKVEYISVLSQAQKAAAHPGIRQVIGFAGELAQLQAGSGGPPAVLDKIDYDEAIDQVAEMYGVPAGIVLGDDVVAGRREARRKAEQEREAMMQAQAAAPALAQGAKAAKDLSEARLSGVPGMGGEETNALQALLNGLGGGGGGAVG